MRSDVGDVIMLQGSEEQQPLLQAGSGRLGGEEWQLDHSVE